MFIFSAPPSQNEIETPLQNDFASGSPGPNPPTSHDEPQRPTATPSGPSGAQPAQGKTEAKDHKDPQAGRANRQRNSPDTCLSENVSAPAAVRAHFSN